MQQIELIIKKYIKNHINYRQFSYQISPLIFEACDGKIIDKDKKDILLNIMTLIEMYLNNEITTEQKLKFNLSKLIKIQ